MQHSDVVGSSTAARTVACPAWRTLKKKHKPTDTSSDAAKEGSMLHEVIALLMEDPTLEPEEFIGYEAFDTVLTEDLLEDKLLPALEAFNNYMPDSDMDLYIERTVTIPNIPGAFGSADLLAYQPAEDILLANDWKFGNEPVEPDNNMQCVFLAWGAWHCKDIEPRLNRNTIVRLAITQYGVMKYWDTTYQYLRTQMHALAAAVKRGDEGTGKFQRGKHCKYCPVRTVCPEHTELAISASKISVPDTPEQMAEWLTVAGDIEAFIKQLRENAHKYMEDGGRIPGYKLKPKQARRTYTDEAKAESVARTLAKRNNNKLKISDLYSKKFLSPAQLEKVLKKHKLPTAAVEENCASLSSGTNIVPEDTPGASVVPAAALSRLAESIG